MVLCEDEWPSQGATPGTASRAPPEPCFYGWIVWFILLISSITVFMGASSKVTFIIDPVREDLKLTQTEIASHTPWEPPARLHRYPWARASTGGAGAWE